nr:hypothetical protein L204_00191 [Cryptococcus depauperatus CBS 7855]
MSASAQQSFRSQLSSFRWANSVQDDSQQSSSSTNPFGRVWNSMSGYIPLRNEGASQEEEAYFALSRWERCVMLEVVVAWGEPLKGRDS